jgi:hypothetical protein
MHFSTLIPLVLSLGQSIVANPLRVDITIDENYLEQSPPALSTIGGPDVPSFRIRAVLVDGPPITSDRFLGFSPSIYSPGQIFLTRVPATFSLKSGALIMPAGGPGTVQPVRQGGGLALVKGTFSPVSWTTARDSRIGDILVPILNGEVQKNGE